ncbi:unnamed protein product [Ectocarpus sp. 12 AP-2014]
MARRRTDDEIKRRMWGALLIAAMKYHKTTKEHGMLTAIAKDADVSKASVSEWKMGKSYPEDFTLRKLANLYGVSADSISGYSDSKESLGPPDELLKRAADMTEAIVEELLPNGTTEQFLTIMRRAHELILLETADNEAHGILFEEARRMKRDG